MKRSSSIVWILKIPMVETAFTWVPTQTNIVDFSKARLHLVASGTCVIPDENIQSLDPSESIRNRPKHLLPELWCQNLGTKAFSSTGICKQKLCNSELTCPNTIIKSKIKTKYNVIVSCPYVDMNPTDQARWKLFWHFQDFTDHM